MSSLTEHSVSFIVRIWHEPGRHESDPAQWRGSIEEVESGERVYFTAATRMLVFLRNWVARVGIEIDI